MRASFKCNLILRVCAVTGINTVRLCPRKFGVITSAEEAATCLHSSVAPSLNQGLMLINPPALLHFWAFSFCFSSSLFLFFFFFLNHICSKSTFLTLHFCQSHTNINTAKLPREARGLHVHDRAREPAAERRPQQLKDSCWGFSGNIWRRRPAAPRGDAASRDVGS